MSLVLLIAGAGPGDAMFPDGINSFSSLPLTVCMMGLRLLLLCLGELLGSGGNVWVEFSIGVFLHLLVFPIVWPEEDKSYTQRFS